MYPRIPTNWSRIRWDPRNALWEPLLYVNMPGDQNWVTKFHDTFPNQITTKPVKIFFKAWKCSHTIMRTMLYCNYTWLNIGTVR
jgi:hypothetical protein